jgi:hypothetical protein
MNKYTDPGFSMYPDLDSTFDDKNSNFTVEKMKKTTYS